MVILAKEKLVGSFQDLHSLTKGNRVSLVRIHFSHPQSDGKSADVGVGGRIGILNFIGCTPKSDSVERHLSRRHLSVLNLKFDFIFDGGRTREEKNSLSLKRHLFPHAGRKPKAFWIYFSTLPPILNIFSNL